MEKKEELLALKDLKSYYPQKNSFFLKQKSCIKAVDGINLSVNRGEVLGIVGESGCGKSTLAKTIIGLKDVTEGEIWFEGKNIAELSNKEAFTFKSKVQMVFQDPYSFLNPHHKIRTILGEPLLLHHIVEKKDVDEEIDRLLESVGLSPEHKNRYPSEFSGGQRQRIGIAKALSVRPELIICDEPVSALDVSVQAQILNLFKDLQKEKNLTYIFIAHGLDAVRYISDKVAVMYKGKIVEYGDTEEIFKNPQHQYTKKLLYSHMAVMPGRTMPGGGKYEDVLKAKAQVPS